MEPNLQSLFLQRQKILSSHPTAAVRRMIAHPGNIGSSRHPDRGRQAISRRTGTMSNPVVLITGALTGIGRATAIAFAKQGARLVVAGRREDAGQQLTTEL